MNDALTVVFYVFEGKDLISHKTNAVPCPRDMVSLVVGGETKLFEVKGRTYTPQTNGMIVRIELAEFDPKWG